MFPDKSLMPREAVRLAALGILADGERTYASLANAVRDFTSRFWGPTLDVMATSIELLHYEGLIEVAEEGPSTADTRLRLTDAGRRELAELLSASIRAPSGDFGRLIVALKMKFLHCLPPSARAEQIDMLIEGRQAELARLVELRTAEADAQADFLAWLDHDIARIRGELAWFETLRRRIAPGA